MGSAETWRRQLGVFARAPALTGEHFPFNVVVVLRLAGPPEPKVLARAFETLQVRHPLLGARIVRQAGRRYFEPATVATGELSPVPLCVVEERSRDDAWQAVAEAELETGFDAAGGPLLRCALLRSTNGGRGEIVLCFHHAIFDAASGVRLCGELLRLCAAIAAGGPVEAAEPLPEGTPEGRFPPAFRGLRRLRPLASFVLRQLADEALFRWRSRGRRRPAVDPRARCRIAVFELSAATASRLARRARRHRLTLTGALQAALLLAVSRHLYGGRGQPLRSFVFPDLRPYLRPPVPAELLGAYFAVVRFSVPVAGDSDFWGLGLEIHRRIHAAHRRGEKYAAALLSERTMGMMLRARTRRMGNAALSYTGVAGLEPAYGATAVLGLHAFVSSTSLGPEYAVQARRLHGRLLLDAVFLDADMDRRRAARIGAEITSLLQRAAREEER